ncbi:hypothetical protein GALMADRAFT_210638 [Galerina marginata CBS 339.88]|uniref:Uncharacterized protein n=1 Tax=Galerina marginata (strain CBS 339.88) TaxID=685588 RepID=A0A067T0N7_GALM3|nr:hypothetical protein GALMADRAFT_210638 [Galerina marginata CBS 339.88]
MGIYKTQREFQDFFRSNEANAPNVCTVIIFQPGHANDFIHWQGKVVNNQFFLSSDHDLCQHIDLTSTRYMLYRPWERPHWVLNNPRVGQPVEPQEILIYKPWGSFDSECPGLSFLVRLVHQQLAQHSMVAFAHDVPARYQARDIKEHHPNEEDGEQESDEDTEEEYYFMVNPTVYNTDIDDEEFYH